MPEWVGPPFLDSEEERSEWRRFDREIEAGILVWCKVCHSHTSCHFATTTRPPLNTSLVERRGDPVACKLSDRNDNREGV